MEVLQLETLTGLVFSVSLYLLELMHFKLGSACLEITRTLLKLACVLLRFESRIYASPKGCWVEFMLNPKAVETKGNKKFLHRDQAALKGAANGGCYEASCRPTPHLSNHRIVCKLDTFFSLSAIRFKMVLTLPLKVVMESFRLTCLPSSFHTTVKKKNMMKCDCKSNLGNFSPHPILKPKKLSKS